MLDYLRQQVIDTLKQKSQVTLTTNGIAGLQTNILSCESCEMNLFVLVPRTSDHLVNIDQQPECVVVTDGWELRGVAKRTATQEHPELSLGKMPNAEWSTLVEIHPTRLQILQKDGAGYAATIDID